MIQHATQVMELLDAEGGVLHACLWRLTQRADVAEDLMQELVIKLARSDTFAKADRPGAFARRAATNLALDWRRKQRRRGPVASWGDVEWGWWGKGPNRRSGWSRTKN